MSARELFQIFGSLMWANYAIMRQPLARWNDALAHIRSTARSMYAKPQSWDTPSSVPASVQDELAEMINLARVSTLTLKDLTPALVASTQWSDACSTCFGYLRYSQNTVYGLSRTYEGLDIYTAELLAGADSLASSPDVPHQIMDNQPAIRALRKGHSSTAAGNLIIQRLWEQYSQPTAYLSWTPSGCNLSDPMSRGCGRYPVTERNGLPCIHVTAPGQLQWKPRSLRT